MIENKPARAVAAVIVGVTLAFSADKIFQNFIRSDIAAPGVKIEKIDPMAYSLKIAELARNEALAKGKNRIPLPQEIFDAKGEIVETSMGCLAVIIPDATQAAFASFTKGHVIAVQEDRKNAARSILFMDERQTPWKVIVAATTEILAVPGQELDFGQPHFRARYRREDGNQRVFELAYGLPPGAVAVICAYDPQTLLRSPLSVNDNLLRDGNGQIMTIPTLPYIPPVKGAQRA